MIKGLFFKINTIILTFLILVVTYVHAFETDLFVDQKDEIVSKARELLVKEYALIENNCELKVKNSINANLFKDKSIQFKFSSFGQYWVKGEGYRKDKKVFTLMIIFELFVYEKVLCANRDIKAREILLRDDFDLKRMLIKKNARIRYVTSYDQLIGKRAKFSISQGTILSADRIEPSPSILKYDDIKVVIIKNSFVVSRKAKALQDGYIGTEISVRLENGKIMRGLINSSNEVEIKM